MYIIGPHDPQKPHRICKSPVAYLHSNICVSSRPGSNTISSAEPARLVKEATTGVILYNTKQALSSRPTVIHLGITSASFAGFSKTEITNNASRSVPEKCPRGQIARRNDTRTNRRKVSHDGLAVAEHRDSETRQLGQAIRTVADHAGPGKLHQIRRGHVSATGKVQQRKGKIYLRAKVWLRSMKSRLLDNISACSVHVIILATSTYRPITTLTDSS